MNGTYVVRIKHVVPVLVANVVFADMFRLLLLVATCCFLTLHCEYCDSPSTLWCVGFIICPTLDRSTAEHANSTSFDCNEVRTYKIKWMEWIDFYVAVRLLYFLTCFNFVPSCFVNIATHHWHDDVLEALFPRWFDFRLDVGSDNRQPPQRARERPPQQEQRTVRLESLPTQKAGIRLATHNSIRVRCHGQNSQPHILHANFQFRNTFGSSDWAAY